ncbi:hypothetical protein ACJRO7_004874 [Eucalyptus globulus]|uniref:Uncharacterized protein n=1 Tax=Eucalyptus globulus TaxID=34317 RepID=A0ABD3J078_EUCGL
MPAPGNTGNEASVINLRSVKDKNTSDSSEYSKYGSDSANESEDIAPDQGIISSCYASKAVKAQDVGKVQELQAQSSEGVDDRLKSLKHILSQHHDEAHKKIYSIVA